MLGGYRQYSVLVFIHDLLFYYLLTGLEGKESGLFFDRVMFIALLLSVVQWSFADSSFLQLISSWITVFSGGWLIRVMLDNSLKKVAFISQLKSYFTLAKVFIFSMMLFLCVCGIIMYVGWPEGERETFTESAQFAGADEWSPYVFTVLGGVGGSGALIVAVFAFLLAFKETSAWKRQKRLELLEEIHDLTIKMAVIADPLIEFYTKENESFKKVPPAEYIGLTYSISSKINLLIKLTPRREVGFYLLRCKKMQEAIEQFQVAINNFMVCKYELLESGSNKKRIIQGYTPFKSSAFLKAYEEGRNSLDCSGALGGRFLGILHEMQKKLLDDFSRHSSE